MADSERRMQSRFSRRRMAVIVAIVVAPLIGFGAHAAVAKPEAQFCTLGLPIGLTEADYDNPPPEYAGSMYCWNSKVKQSILMSEE